MLATLHTIDAPETINRLLDFFPAESSSRLRALLAGALKGVISQRLVVTTDGVARTSIAEVLTMSNRVVKRGAVDAEEALRHATSPMTSSSC